MAWDRSSIGDDSVTTMESGGQLRPSLFHVYEVYEKQQQSAECTYDM